MAVLFLNKKHIIRKTRCNGNGQNDMVYLQSKVCAVCLRVRKGMRIQMTKRVLIGMAVVLGIVLAILLCVVLFQQKLPMEGTLV